MPFGKGPRGARLALVALLASGCTLGLDWTPNSAASSDASFDDRATPLVPDVALPPQDLNAPDTRDGNAPDIAPVPDAPQPDAPQPDVPALDSGAVDTGIVMGRCGGHDERCCSFGACSMGRICLQRMGEPAALCRDCGGNNQPCCANGACDRDRVCELRTGAPVCR